MACVSHRRSVAVTARREHVSAANVRAQRLRHHDRTLAYDNPGKVATISRTPAAVTDCARSCACADSLSATRPTITPEAVTAFASKAMQFGLPLNDDALAHATARADSCVAPISRPITRPRPSAISSSLCLPATRASTITPTTPSSRRRRVSMASSPSS